MVIILPRPQHPLITAARKCAVIHKLDSVAFKVKLILTAVCKNSGIQLLLLLWKQSVRKQIFNFMRFEH